MNDQNHTSGNQRPRMILLGRMYKKVSQRTGEEYFRGTLGYPITFLFKDKSASEDNVWCLYAQERDVDDSQGNRKNQYPKGVYKRTDVEPW